MWKATFLLGEAEGERVLRSWRMGVGPSGAGEGVGAARVVNVTRGGNDAGGGGGGGREVGECHQVI